jgi:hypothetical protein
VRLTRTNIDSSNGTLSLEEVHPNCVEVLYIPEDQKIARFKELGFERENYRAKLILISGQDHFVTIYPINTNPENEDFLEQKYNDVVAIIIDDFDLEAPDDVNDVLAILEDFPSRFVKDYDFGLGLQKDYRFIVHAIEELTSCSEIVVSNCLSTGVNKDAPELFNLARKDFEDIRKSINRTTRRAQQAAVSVKRAETHNALAQKLGKEPKQIKLGRHPVTKLLTLASKGEAELDGATQEALLKSVSENKVKIAREKPDKLAKLVSLNWI